MAIPSSAAEITPAWLSDAMGTIVASIEVTPIESRAGLLGSRSRLRVTYSGGRGPATLIAKFPSAGVASRTLANQLGVYRKEVRFYKELAKRAVPPLEKCFYAELDDETQDCILLMEDLPNARVIDQLQGCSVADAGLAVERLADLHTSFWEDGEVAAADWMGALSDSPLPEIAVRSYRASWGPAQILFGDRIPTLLKEFGDHFDEILPELMQRLSGAPTTLSHGDYRLDNIHFSETDVVVGDWHLVDRARGARDLAYFLVGSLTPADRAAHEIDLVAAYAARLWANGVTGYCSKTCWEDYLFSVLFNFGYAIVGGGGIIHGDARSRSIAGAVIDRACAAILDLDCLALVNAD